MKKRKKFYPQTLSDLFYLQFLPWLKKKKRATIIKIAMMNSVQWWWSSRNVWKLSPTLLNIGILSFFEDFTNVLPYLRTSNHAVNVIQDMHLIFIQSLKLLGKKVLRGKKLLNATDLPKKQQQKSRSQLVCSLVLAEWGPPEAISHNHQRKSNTEPFTELRNTSIISLAGKTAVTESITHVVFSM